MTKTEAEMFDRLKEINRLIRAASGTGARSGETEGLDPKGDGPVAKPDAQAGELR